MRGERGRDRGGPGGGRGGGAGDRVRVEEGWGETRGETDVTCHKSFIDFSFLHPEVVR